MRDACISGIGRTAISRQSGRSVLQLAAEAVTAAVDDAGLSMNEIDGLATYSMDDSVSPDSVAMAAGVPELTWSLDWLSGGSASMAIVGYAAMALAAGMANHIVVYRALNGSSGHRLGSTGVEQKTPLDALTARYGFGTPVQWYAMACQRHMHVYGSSSDALASIAVRQREYAHRNPMALMKGIGLTTEDYYRSPFIAEPFRLYDCCQETDGAVAAVVSRSLRVGADGRRDIQVLSVAYTSPFGSEPPYEKYEDLTLMFPHWLSDRLFANSNMNVDSIDLAYLYDAFTFAVLCQLEDFGFCKKGEGSAFVLDGIDRPRINTNGGLLSEGYIHGLNNLVEAVVQLRGEAGERQIERAETALVSGFGYSRGSALILGRR